MTTKEKVELLIKITRSFGNTRRRVLAVGYDAAEIVEHRMYLLMPRPLDKMSGDDEASKYPEYYIWGDGTLEEMVEVKITCNFDDDEIRITSKSYQENMNWDGKKWIEEEDFVPYWFEKNMEELVKLADWTVSGKLRKRMNGELPRSLEEAEEVWDRYCQEREEWEAMDGKF